MLAVAADLRKVALMDGELDRPAMTGGGSIYPFCWNLLLSARAHGLGGVMTTFLSRVEPVAAPPLGLPPHHALVATIFLGVPEHQPTKLTTQPRRIVHHHRPLRRPIRVTTSDEPTDRGWTVRSSQSGPP